MLKKLKIVMSFVQNFLTEIEGTKMDKGTLLKLKIKKQKTMEEGCL